MAMLAAKRKDGGKKRAKNGVANERKGPMSPVLRLATTSGALDTILLLDSEVDTSNDGVQKLEVLKNGPQWSLAICLSSSAVPINLAQLGQEDNQRGNDCAACARSSNPQRKAARFLLLIYGQSPQAEACSRWCRWSFLELVIVITILSGNGNGRKRA